VAPPAHPGDAQPPFRRVAVALELGPADGPVLAHLVTMTRTPETEVVLVHIAESAASRYLGAESSDRESREDTEQLDRVAARLREYGLRARARLGHGEVPKELGRLVNEEQAELLITGAHGHKLIGDLVHGATVSAVRHLVTCPVLTVRTKAD
jgi:manganese transport protein